MTKSEEAKNQRKLEYNRRYRAAHKADNAAYQKAYYEAHKEELRQKHLAWYYDNKEYFLRYLRERYHRLGFTRNREHYNEYQRKWQQRRKLKRLQPKK